MPQAIAVILLGIIEGITEFLPISSTGHLLIAEHWIPAQSEMFNVVIQCGAVLAVFVVFARRLRQMISELDNPATRDYLIKLLVAFILTGIGGLALKKAGFDLPKTLSPTAWATLIGGIVILIIEFLVRDKPKTDFVTWPIALVVAAGQLLAAACPGTSRSGATILFAMALGLSRVKATEFSFLVGIPTMFAAGAYEIHHELKHAPPGSIHWNMVIMGTIVAAITAFITVKWLLRFVQSHTFNGFGWYRIALGIAIFFVLWKQHPQTDPAAPVSLAPATVKVQARMVEKIPIAPKLHPSAQPNQPG
jgi:undecaprenyl-diphosphatase